MKKILSLIALATVSVVSADPYYQGYSSYPNDGRYYQDSNYNYQQNWESQQQPQATYYQRDDRNYQSNDGRYYQDSNSANYYYQPRRDSTQRPQGVYYQKDNQNYQSNQYYQQSDNRNNYVNQNPGTEGTVSDQEISKKIHETLSSGWFSKRFQYVSYQVNNGNVTLRGTVDSVENKNKAEESVRKIDGVKQVDNQITVDKEVTDNYSNSQTMKSENKLSQDFASNLQDRQINAKIREKLRNGWFSKNYDTIILKTTNGIVIITGIVDKSEDIKKVNDQVKSVEGVKSVNNQLNVKVK